MYFHPRQNIKQQLIKQVAILLRPFNFAGAKILFLLVTITPSTVLAETTKADVIAKIATAYDGTQLKKIKAITLIDYRKNAFPQRNSPSSEPDIMRFNEELTIDFVNKKKAFVSWRVNSTNKDLEKYIADEKSGRVYDILHGKYSDDNWYNYTNTGGSLERSSDTLIAKKLLSAPNTFRIIDEVQYQGQPHYKIAFTISDQSQSNVYINKLSGLINKVSRTHPELGALTYVFSNHSKIGNIAFAQDMNFSVGGNLRTISIYRNIELSPNLSDKFSIPEEFSSWGVRTDGENMLYNKLENNVYYVGKNSSRSLFIDAGEYYISIGGNDALKENLTHLQKKLNTKKNLKFAVLTHHHRSQLNMIKPALELKAKVVTVASNLSAIEAKLDRKLDKNNFMLVNESKEFLNGNLKIFNIATAHADHNLVAYLEKEKIIFAEDHYEILYKKGNPRSFKNMVIFADKIEGLGLDVLTLINGASPRALSIDEFKDTIDSYISPLCPQGYQVCQNG